MKLCINGHYQNIIRTLVGITRALVDIAVHNFDQRFTPCNQLCDKIVQKLFNVTFSDLSDCCSLTYLNDNLIRKNSSGNIIQKYSLEIFTEINGKKKKALAAYLHTPYFAHGIFLQKNLNLRASLPYMQTTSVRNARLHSPPCREIKDSFDVFHGQVLDSLGIVLLALITAVSCNVRSRRECTFSSGYSLVGTHGISPNQSRSRRLPG